MDETRLVGQPKLGHYNTWLVDKLQLLVEKNHGIASTFPWVGEWK
jgi:hypothetical protein